MAYIPEDDKQIEEGQPGAQPNVAGSGGFSGPSNQGSSLVGSGGGGVSTAGVGQGGTGGWTNVQAYIQANKGYQSGADKDISQKLGSQLDQEKQKLTNETQQVKSSLSQQQEKAKEAKDNYGQWVNQAAQNYQWGAQQQPQAYQDYFSKLQGALNQKYQGPDQVSYTRSNDTQRYNDALNDDQGFRNLVSEYYRDKGGGRLSSGQRALQDQLDINNDALNQARASLRTQYQDFGNQEAQELGNVNQLINQTKEQVGNLNLRNLLQNDADQLNQQIAQQEAQALYNYENDYRNFKTGKATGWARDPNYKGNAVETALRNAGLWSDNLTPELMQRQMDLKGYLADNPRSLASPYFQDIRGYLNNWYGEQDTKYGNTADSEERKWNLIQDLLGATGPRKEQGFKVRG